MPAAISSLHWGPLALSQASTPARSLSTADQPSPRTRAIHVVIPPAQATLAHATPVQDMFATAAASGDAVLHAEWTPTHGHGDFVVLFASTPPAARMSARVRRRNSLFSASGMTDGGVDAHAEPEAAGAGAGSLTMSPAEESEERGVEEREASGDAGRVHTASAGYSVDGAEENAPPPVRA